MATSPARQNGDLKADKQRKVLYMDVLILRSHGCEGAVNTPLKGGTNSKIEY